MKAVVIRRYGKSDVLEFADVPTPSPKKNEVLVKISAFSINPIELELRKGRMPYTRFSSWPKIFGSDLAGEVVAKGSIVKNLEVGQWVLGMSPVIRGGAYAEYIAISANHVSPIPSNLHIHEAASVPLVALTSLQGLRDQGKIEDGQNIFMHGCSGGVGTLAIQIAKQLGAKVTGSSSAKNIEMCLGLGADAMVDYASDDFLSEERAYDIFYDIYGNKSLSKISHTLRAKGRYISTIPSPKNFKAQLMTRFRDKKAKVVVVRPKREDLALIVKWMEEGSLKPVVDRVMPWKDIRSAHDFLQTRRAKGKVVLEVYSPTQ